MTRRQIPVTIIRRYQRQPCVRELSEVAFCKRRTWSDRLQTGTSCLLSHGSVFCRSMTILPSDLPAAVEIAKEKIEKLRAKLAAKGLLPGPP